MWLARIKLAAKCPAVSAPIPPLWTIGGRCAVTEAAQALQSPDHRLSFSEIPSPKGLPLVGTTLSLLAAGSYPRLHEYVDARHKELGSVYREAIGPADAVFVSDPQEIQRVFRSEGRAPKHLLPEPWVLYNELFGCKRGLFFMDGEEWIKYRRIMNKLLLKATPGAPASAEFLSGPCHSVSDNMLHRWKQIQKCGEIQNMEAELYRWSINTVIATLLGGNFYASLSSNEGMKSAKGQALESAVNELSSVVHLVFKESARLTLLPARLAYALHLPAWSKFVHAVNTALSSASALVHELIEWCNEDNQRSMDEKGLLTRMLAEGIDSKDAVRIVTDLLLAAGDTTAYSTQWTMYLLAKHPEVQEKVLCEIKEAGLYKNATNSSGDAMIKNLPLLKGVIREALRLYPVAPFLTRILPEDCPIGGYNVPAGNLVLLSIYTSGRDSHNFPDPLKFWPERWMREVSKPKEHGERDEGSFSDKGRSTSQKSYIGVNNPYASLPFGLGARSCIGRKIAEMQMTMTIAKMISNFHMDLLNKEEVQMILRLVSVPATPIKIRFRER